MELDDVTQTGDLPAQDAPPRREPLPWVLLAVVTVVGLVVGTLGWARALSDGARADDAATSEAKCQVEAAEKAARLEDVEKQKSELDAQLKALSAERDGLAQRVKALEDQVVASATPAAVPDKAPALKSKKKKSLKRRRR
jgi:Tfp pilus assembly protein FimV